MLGGALLALFVVLAVHAFPDEPKPFLAPRTVRLTLETGKDQTIYRQTRGSGYVSLDETPSCNVRRAPNGAFLPLRRHSGSTTLGFGTDKYVAELHFEPPTDGVYVIRCGAPFGRRVPLAVGNRPHLGRFVVFLVAAIASGGLGTLLAAGVGVLVAVLRGRHKRRLQDEAMTSTYAPGGPAPGR